MKNDTVNSEVMSITRWDVLTEILRKGDGRPFDLTIMTVKD